MKTKLQHLLINQFKTLAGKPFDIPLSYQTFGPALHSAPIVLVNHALSGNSNVAGENGWWKSLIGDHKTIDTLKYTVLCFNIPGNGYDGFLIEDEKKITTSDLAKIFIKGLEQLGIHRLFSIIGSSIGGAIGWEMVSQKPFLAENFIPIATDYKTTDWLHSQCIVQDFLLESKENALQKARFHAMLTYRTPESLNRRFQRKTNPETQILASQDWLNFHGKALEERFSIQSYRLMNQLLKTIDTSLDSLKKIQSKIHLVAVDSDLFFPAFEIKNTYHFLIQNNQNVHYHEIESIHGHDAFLIEYQQLNTLINKILEE